MGIRQRADDDAVGAERTSEADVTRDRLELVGVVHEPTAAGPHEHVHEAGNGGCCSRLDRGLDKSRRRGQPADTERLAQLDARCAGFEGDPDARDVLHGNLHRKGCSHSATLSIMPRRYWPGPRIKGTLES
jgi:hypothetical protein